MAEFVYTTYIRTTPERLWQALTEPAFTSRYWGATFESEWTTGAPVVWHESGVRMADPEQVVVEATPHERLSYTWHTLTEEFGKAHDIASDELATLAAEPRSTVTFTIEPRGDMVRLTVVHDGFAPGSELLSGVSQGWPEILASLKTLLETGSPL